MSVVKSGFSDGVGNVNVKIFVGKKLKKWGEVAKNWKMITQNAKKSEIFSNFPKNWVKNIWIQEK